MNSIPVIIVHKGNPFYLKFVLKQIRLYNPNNRICLISDYSTKNKYDFVEHYDWRNYSVGASTFEKIYIHMSSNTYEFELICFQRWFIVRDFIRAHGLTHFLCLDSDVLLYCNIDKVYSRYFQYDFTIGDGGLPHCSLFNNESIDKLCNYITALYSVESNLIRLKSYYKIFEIKSLLGGVCDMTALLWYQTDISDNVINISLPFNGSCFDNNISSPDSFEMKKGKKKIYWKENLPHGKLLDSNSFIQFNCIHLQGRTKYSIYEYLVDENKVHHSGFWYTLKWLLSKDIVCARLNGVRKVINNPQLLINFIKAKLK